MKQSKENNEKIIRWKDIKHFKKKEFDCHDGSNANKMNLQFVKLLDEIREEYGKMVITSGYRTETWNLKVGGARNSAHTRGLAADILCKDGAHRYKLVGIAIKKGIKRIGIGKDFVHLDIDKTLPNPRIWLY